MSKISEFLAKHGDTIDQFHALQKEYKIQEGQKLVGRWFVTNESLASTNMTYVLVIKLKGASGDFAFTQDVSDREIGYNERKVSSIQQMKELQDKEGLEKTLLSFESRIKKIRDENIELMKHDLCIS